MDHDSKRPTGFKEWLLICEALGKGEQSLILRKGGIAEGRGGFGFDCEEFFLFPTLYHQQQEKVRLAPGADSVPQPNSEAGQIRIDHFAKIEWAGKLDSLEQALKLTPFHIWKEEVIEERFHYKGQGEISLAFLRVFRLESPWLFPDSKAYGGCRSWVELPPLEPWPAMRPVLEDAEHERLDRKIRSLTAF